ncbi:M24 family metallopeptidase [Thermoanaerobacterium thermosaccharolyticum]|uniref:Xaa-Pro aminopeptidase n=1 Tax=Thermoanaerobacterium thermosaccharolyticum M0795 TaxID=698948 RepID=L0ILR2_THETR|nr:Xaa-Pro peptidase family protein [Thermoanaerobacterium thermosaccharolyticum]AGB18902.1 Xaa-Pro aminopeptidase [Thermoanaerobacterium thermosaccharolyticum M0795]
MNNRLDAARRLLIEKELDGFIVFKPVNVTYLTGFTGDDSIAIISLNESYFITDSRYTEQASHEIEDFKIIEHKSGIFEAIKDCVNMMGINKLGFEENYITFEQYNKLKNMLNVVMKPENSFVESLREIKDDTEIENIKKAQFITDETFKYFIKFVKPGMKEKDVALEMEYYMKKLGADDKSFDFIVASGKRSSMPHGKASDKVIENGDFVTFDYGCKVNGYCSDMTRTIVVGKANEKQREIYNTVLEAQINAINNLKSGMIEKEGDYLARKIIVERGYGDYFGHSLGHGVGLEIHEKPFMGPRGTNLLKSGMVVTVEPGIYIPEFSGVRIEDMVLLKEDGVIDLTNSPKELIEV